MDMPHVHPILCTNILILPFQSGDTSKFSVLLSGEECMRLVRVYVCVRVCSRVFECVRVCAHWWMSPFILYKMNSDKPIRTTLRKPESSGEVKLLETLPGVEVTPE